MDESLIEKYKAEMLNLYRSSKQGASQNAQGEKAAVPAAADVQTENPVQPANSPENTGKLIVMVSTLRSSFPLKNARVTIFTGDSDNMQVVDTDFTDESGRTKAFALETSAKALSMTSSPDGKPYATYNIEIKAEGYCDSLYLNVPIFSGVTSIQQANMLLLETAGRECPLVFDSSQAYTLGDEQA